MAQRTRAHSLYAVVLDAGPGITCLLSSQSHKLGAVLEQATECELSPLPTPASKYKNQRKCTRNREKVQGLDPHSHMLCALLPQAPSGVSLPYVQLLIERPLEHYL